MNIRQAMENDLDAILSIYEKARRYMRESGNPTQWGFSYPPKELIISDIENGDLFVGTDDSDIPHFVFGFFEGPDPTYNIIEDGAWPNDAPYRAIHRIASDGTIKGAVSHAVSFASQFTDELRIDTHEDNKTMQHVLEKLGFIRCGRIYTLEGSPRIAYQRSDQKAQNEKK